MSDPRELGGDIVGPGGPYERSGVVVDTTNAVLTDGQTVSIVETHRGDELNGAIALLLEGRINKTSDRVKVLFLLNEDGAAALVAEMTHMAIRAETVGMLPGFAERLKERLDAMPEIPKEEA